MAGAGDDSAGVRFPPPFIYLGLLLLGFALDELIGAPLPASLPLAFAIGMLLILSGGILLATALGAFRRAGNDPEPWKPVDKFIAEGIYTRTRNPMYLALAFIYLGVALALRSIGALVLFPVAIALVQIFVIRREEAYLERRFGRVYLDYKAEVGRWF
jgi:protein-S-isoprenylcysteine O-methyltransferase Ste14